MKESKWLVKCFLNYLRHDKTEVNVLFEILSIFLYHTRIDFTFLKEFYIIEVMFNHFMNTKFYACKLSTFNWCHFGLGG